MKTHLRLSVIVAIVLSIPAFGFDNPMKPGLWEVSMKTTKDGKEYDPQASMRESMSKMSPEQRKQMAAMLANSGIGMGGAGDNGTKVCYTKEALSWDNFGANQERHCETTVKEQTKKHVKVDFKCDDGATGTGDWNFPSSTAYNGKMKFTRKNGEVSDMAMNGRFLDKDCGDVRPIQIPPRQ